MLKLIEQYKSGGMSVEIFRTAHTGPDWHVRYGLEVMHHGSLERAQEEFDNCVGHLRTLRATESSLP